MTFRLMIGKQVCGALASLLIWGGTLTGHAAELPKVLAQYFKIDAAIKGEVVVVIPPEEINIYIDKVKQASQKDPEWFAEYSAKASPGVPLPFHEKLGLTDEEYKKYRQLWTNRKFEVTQNIGIRLEQVDDEFMIRVTGKGAKISLLRFQVKEGHFRSPNGVMKRIKDIDADAESILGAWAGQEWKFQEETGLGITKENFALGKTGDKKFGMMVYRLQDVSSTGRTLYDNSVVIRFALPAKGK